MALTNVTAFTLGIRRFAAQQEKKVEDVTKGVSLYAHRNLVMGTRVDTGRARGNWQTQESTPPEGHQPDKFDPTGAATIAEGAATISQASGQDVIWIHNGVPYISVLESWDHTLAGTVEAARTFLRSQGWGR